MYGSRTIHLSGLSPLRILSITYPVDNEMFRGSTSVDGAEQRHEAVRMKSVRSENIKTFSFKFHHV